MFGALVAASIPVLLAITSALTATWLLAIPGHWLPVGSETSTVVLLIGMAVGVDYSLFFLRRYREERARGASPSQAIAAASRTSGRAIVVSGLTVMTALAGLMLTGYSLFTGMAIGAIVVVGIAVTGSLTVLPARPGSGTGSTRAGSRSSAAGARRRRRPGCGPAWSAGWSAARWPGAARPRSRCWPSPRQRRASASPTRRSTPRRACPWCPP